MLAALSSSGNSGKSRVNSARMPPWVEENSGLIWSVIIGAAVVGYFMWNRRRVEGQGGRDAPTPEELRELNIRRGQAARATPEELEVASNTFFANGDGTLGSAMDALKVYNRVGVSVLLVLDDRDLATSILTKAFARLEVREQLSRDGTEPLDILPVHVNLSAEEPKNEAAFFLKSFRLQARQLPVVLFMTGTHEGIQMMAGADFHGMQLRRLAADARHKAHAQGLAATAPWRQTQAAMADGLQTGWLVFNGTLRAGDFLAPEMPIPGMAVQPEPAMPDTPEMAEERRRAEQLERLTREQLRLEQDQEFADAQAEDAKRVREREQAEQEKADAEFQAAIALSLEEDLDRKAQLDFERDLKSKKQRLTEEPAPGDGVVKLRFRMPEGATATPTVQRHFRSDDSVARLFDYVDICLESTGKSDFKLTLSPNTLLNHDESTSLASAGVARMSMILVEMDDEDEDEDEADEEE